MYLAVLLLAAGVPDLGKHFGNLEGTLVLIHGGDGKRIVHNAKAAD